MRKNKTVCETTDSNPKLTKLAEELPSLEFKGKRTNPLKSKHNKRKEH